MFFLLGRFPQHTPYLNTSQIETFGKTLCLNLSILSIRMNTFSILLKQERIKSKMTLKEMADELGISERAYRNYESLKTNHREPSLELLTKIASVLGVTVGYLLGVE